MPSVYVTSFVATSGSTWEYHTHSHPVLVTKDKPTFKQKLEFLRKLCHPNTTDIVLAAYTGGTLYAKNAHYDESEQSSFREWYSLQVDVFEMEDGHVL